MDFPSGYGQIRRECLTVSWISAAWNPLICYSSCISYHCGQTPNKKQLKGKTNGFVLTCCLGVQAIKAGKQFSESDSGW